MAVAGIFIDMDFIFDGMGSVVFSSMVGWSRMVKFYVVIIIVGVVVAVVAAAAVAAVAA